MPDTSSFERERKQESQFQELRSGFTAGCPAPRSEGVVLGRSNKLPSPGAPNVFESLNLVEMPFDENAVVVIRHIPVNIRTFRKERVGDKLWASRSCVATGLKAVESAAFLSATYARKCVALVASACLRSGALGKRMAANACSVMLECARRPADWSMRVRPLGRRLRDEGRRHVVRLRVSTQDSARAARVRWSDWLGCAAGKAESALAVSLRRVRSRIHAVRTAARPDGYVSSRESLFARPALRLAIGCLAVALFGGFATARLWGPQSTPPTPRGLFSQSDAVSVKPLASLDRAAMKPGPTPQFAESAGLERGLVWLSQPSTEAVAGDRLQRSSVVTVASYRPQTNPSRAPTGSRKREQANLACQYATTPAEKLVCADRRLQRADRALKSAYDRALAAGVPGQVLEAEHEDWLEMREDAARHSRREVAALYLRRTSHINLLADPPH
jgi:uncharacterized protein YecT (DUF1311 family)